MQYRSNMWSSNEPIKKVSQTYNDDEEIAHEKIKQSKEGK